MKNLPDPKDLAKLVKERLAKHSPLLAVIKTPISRADLVSYANSLAKSLKMPLVRSGYTPNSELSLFEYRGKKGAIVLLVLRHDDERLVAIDDSSDDEIAEIESNIYSSNINDVYVRLVSDIF